MDTGRLGLLKEDIQRAMQRLDDCRDANDTRELLVTVRKLIGEIDRFLADREGFDS